MPNRVRLVRYLLLIGMYAVISAASFVAAYFIRFDGAIPSDYRVQMFRLMPFAVAANTVILIALGQASALPTYFSMVDLRALIIGAGSSTIVILSGSAFAGLRVPRGVTVLDFILLLGGIAGARAVLRYIGERRRAGRQPELPGQVVTRPTAIVGAGEAGAAIVRELLNNSSLRFKPIVFFDDDPMKWD